MPGPRSATRREYACCLRTTFVTFSTVMSHGAALNSCRISPPPRLFSEPLIEGLNLRRHEAQSELGSAPEHILGRPRPLVVDKVADLGLGQRRRNRVRASACQPRAKNRAARVP